MNALGLRAGDYKEEILHVWPENWPVVQVFDTMATQWRVGSGGPIGLDYNALPFVMRTYGVPRKEWQSILEGIRVMESEALKIIHDK